MIQICDNNFCTGCMACANVCYSKAIEMIPDAEGFLHPSVNQNLCKECGLCYRICPVNTPIEKKEPLAVYSGWNKQNSIRMQSSSGGVFSEIAKSIVQKGGVVFGCILDRNQRAIHSYVENECQLELFRGSKYVQSYIGESYKQAKIFLDNGRDVLFSGTPCQISGLRSFLRKEYSNLWTVDVLCHGVPSPLMFEEYKAFIQNEYKDEIKKIVFRSKKNSWIFYGVSISFQTKKKKYYGSYFSDPYIRGFLRNYFLRPSCHQCNYASTARLSDFSIADWWGYKQTACSDKGFRQKGVSAVLVNTLKAKELFSTLNLQVRSRSLDEIIKTNEVLIHPVAPAKERECFWNLYYSSGFNAVKKIYLQPENVKWNIAVLNRFPNTDMNVSFLNKLVYISFVPQKICKLFSGKYSVSQIMSKLFKHYDEK